ncbi:hypothetical protein PAE9249_04980 [Paenibacillus sp. CECT 9249]|uniref:phage tail terminator family protein n=1 Tax=Paenibacillus sp. CECT 9249 TaxID=2845385 RepID=UPI001E454CC9|nr:hypothetical protein [Paenibacillus sp. CECT 9249]CAH0122430.1 hypothetical protein PAE9249_04980 [Paenibacillus sp. CECT 9249]
MITVNDMRIGVVSALERLFPDVPVNSEGSGQGTRGPCLHVELASVSQVRIFGRRYKRTHSFVIRYIPGESTQASNDEFHGKGERLCEGLELIEAGGGLCRGSDMKYEIAEGVLHFSVNYGFHVMREQAQGTKMRHLEQEGTVKDG